MIGASPPFILVPWGICMPLEQRKNKIAVKSIHPAAMAKGTFTSYVTKNVPRTGPTIAPMFSTIYLLEKAFPLSSSERRIENHALLWFSLITIQATNTRFFVVTVLITNLAIHSAWSEHTYINFFFCRYYTVTALSCLSAHRTGLLPITHRRAPGA